MEVSGQLHAWLALHPRKNPRTNLLRGWVGTRTSLEVLENSLLGPAWIPTSDCPTRSLVSIPTTLSLFFVFICCMLISGQAKIVGSILDGVYEIFH
jgi:hypothetical protein